MAAYDPHQPQGSGFFYKLALVFVGSTIAGLVISIYLIVSPQSLDDIGGCDGAAGGRDVSAVLKESQQRQVPVTLTETEINQWLARTIEAKQGGRFADSATFKQVAVRISDGHAEVIMEREIHGRRFTVSMFLTIVQTEQADRLRTELNLHGGRFASWLPAPPKGGRFGKLVVPQGFLQMVMPSYEALAGVLAEELNLGFKQMVRITLQDGSIHLDPRVPRRNADEI